MKSATLLVVLLFAVGLDKCISVRIEVENLPEKCDFSKCVAPDPNKLNVHLVPHTHDDVGWLKTVDQYYYGSRTNIQNAGVQYIIDSVVAALIRNPERKFIYVETAFFSKWWLEQDEQTRAIVRELVRTGQLEFINGGWTMNDEATAHYSSIIDQMTLGLRFLNDTFGHCAIPRVAWQIDPFGHSREQANLFAAMNFDGQFFSRLDFEDRKHRKATKTLEHVWHGSDDTGTSGDLFTSIIDAGFGYGPPRDFKFDLIGGGKNDEPVIDNPDSEEYNVERIVEKFVSISLQFSTNYSTNHVLYPMGEDFNYQDANIWYKNMDKLIKHVNARQSQVKVFYSTPSCYLKALHDSGHVFQTKSDDYFPYASDENSPWTGYFTSRPSLKRMDRVGNNWLQACKQIDVLAKNNGKFEGHLNKLKEAAALMQHHDAVSGTEKQAVANDYAKLLQAGLDACKQVVNYGLKQLVSNFGAKRVADDYQFCDLLNTSACYATEMYRNLVVTLYNPFSQTLTNHTVRLPIVYKPTGEQYIQVRDHAHRPIQSTIFPIAPWVKSIPGRASKATHELVFDVKIPPLGFVSIFIVRSDTPSDNSAVEAAELKITRPTVLKQGKRKIFFGQNGALEGVSVGGKNVSLESDFFYYKGFIGDNKEPANRSSGAYIFRPIEQIPVKVGNLVQSIVYQDKRTKLFEVQQTYDSFVQQTIRFHPSKLFIEFDWFVGSIPVGDGVGKEVIVRYSTNLQSERTFYTDANGRQILKRVWDYRPTWNYTVYEPISSNYYPVNSRIYLRDQSANLQLTVLNDRSQGGTSAQDGQLELMLHRRLLHDDDFGVNETLNETGPDGEGLVVRGTHRLLLDQIDASAPQHRLLGQQLYLEPIIAFVPKFNIGHYSPLYRTTFSGLKTQLPANVHLLTLEQWRAKQILVRLEHFYQKNEHPELSKPATVQLANVLPKLSIVQVEEMTLAANQNIESSKKRLQFKYRNSEQWSRLNPKPTLLSALNGTFTLNPMQIRTFLVTYL